MEELTADDLGESGENLGEECSGLREELAELGGVKGVARQEACCQLGPRRRSTSNKVDDELDNVLAQTGDELESIGDLLEEVVQGKRKSRELTLDGESATKLGQDLESAEERSLVSARKGALLTRRGPRTGRPAMSSLRVLRRSPRRLPGRTESLLTPAGLRGAPAVRDWEGR
jgi:hypothetical protein